MSPWDVIWYTGYEILRQGGLAFWMTTEAALTAVTIWCKQNLRDGLPKSSLTTIAETRFSKKAAKAAKLDICTVISTSSFSARSSRYSQVRTKQYPDFSPFASFFLNSLYVFLCNARFFSPIHRRHVSVMHNEYPRRGLGKNKNGVNRSELGSQKRGWDTSLELRHL